VTDTFEKHFSDCGFDGVFLDRIRSQSFETGISGVLSCACKRCRKSFSEKGVNIDEVRNLYEEQGDAFFDMASWPMNGEFVLEKLSAQRFFEAKEKIIAEAVIGLAGYFRSKGLIVGLDLFAPVISRFVGQNYLLIAKAADFIKPMLYRKTEAPAGIGYEYALFEKYAPGARSKLKPVMDKDFLYSQLQAVKDLPCEQYPGIEINYDKDLVKTDVYDYLEFNVDDEIKKDFIFEFLFSSLLNQYSYWYKHKNVMSLQSFVELSNTILSNGVKSILEYKK
jgi:hypothetical protein